MDVSDAKRGLVLGFATLPMSADVSTLNGCSSGFAARASLQGSTAPIGSTGRKGWQFASAEHDAGRWHPPQAVFLGKVLMILRMGLRGESCGAAKNDNDTESSGLG